MKWDIRNICSIGLIVVVYKCMSYVSIFMRGPSSHATSVQLKQTNKYCLSNHAA